MTTAKKLIFLAADRYDTKFSIQQYVRNDIVSSRLFTWFAVIFHRFYINSHSMRYIVVAPNEGGSMITCDHNYFP